MSSHGISKPQPTMDDSNDTLSFSTRGDHAVENMAQTLRRIGISDDDAIVGLNVEVLLDGQIAADDSDDTDESNESDEQSQSPDTTVDSGRDCPKSGTFKHAVLAMLVRAESDVDVETDYFPPTVLSDLYSDSYRIKRKSISNALGALWRNNRLVERKKGRNVDEFDIAGHEYCYTILDAGRECLDSYDGQYRPAEE